MQTTLQGIVTGLSKYEMDNGAKGASLYMLQPTSGRNPNLIGMEMLKLSLPYTKFEEFRKYENDFNKFAQFQVDAEVEQGGQNKPKITVLAIRPISVSSVEADNKSQPKK